MTRPADLSGSDNDHGRMKIYVESDIAVTGVPAGTVDKISGTEPENDPSDAELARLAVSAIEQSDAGPGQKVSVTVRHGWLLLQGEVEALFQKRAAEEAVRGVNGLRGISNNIVLASEALVHRVSQSIDKCFTLDAKRSARRILVTAYGRSITLSGFARSEFERSEAEAAAWQVPGVAAVVNKIRINT